MLIVTYEKLLFWKKILCSENVVLRMLAKYSKGSNFALAAAYHFSPHE